MSNLSIVEGIKYGQVVERGRSYPHPSRDPRFLVIRSFVARTLEEQHSALSMAENGGDSHLQSMPERVQGYVGEGGYFGVEKAAQRILEFIIPLAGKATVTAGLIREAVASGLEMAGKAFGGKVPTICSETYDTVMRKLQCLDE